MEQTAQAVEALRTALQGFARELVASLQFYQSQQGSLGIREVVVAGGTAQLGGLAETLQRLTGVAVRVGDPLVPSRSARRLRTPTSPALAVPIGLGMAG